MGEVYVGKKPGRGKGAHPTVPNTVNIDVTSGSRKKINNVWINELSPMFLGPVDENLIFNVDSVQVQNPVRAELFENYWQYGKIFQELGHIDSQGQITQNWYNFRSYGYARTKGDRHPKGTKSNEVMYVDDKGHNHYRYYTAISSMYMDNIYDYITSRKYIYVPVYSWLITQTQAFAELKNAVDNGMNVHILDFDVQPGSNLVTLDFLTERINDPSIPFGHGNVVAGMLKGLGPYDYCYN